LSKRVHMRVDGGCFLGLFIEWVACNLDEWGNEVDIWGVRDLELFMIRVWMWCMLRCDYELNGVFLSDVISAGFCWSNVV
ncbi:hypothetical protein, partial [Bacillus pumilus]|uniref:hypothetical protein n=1 Tax=Bacillus pumilus TaxID=1408 RepID=UPI001C92E3CE